MEKLILFIHGLGGTKESFGNFKQFINEDEELSSWDVAFYEYPTSLIHVPYINKYPKIQSLSKDLEGEINAHFSNYNEIVLVCHSMGGLIAKKYLVDNLEMIKLNEIKVTKVVLYATPNIGSDLAFGVYSFHPQIAQLRKSSDFLEELNKNFISSSIFEYIDFNYIIGSLDRVVDRVSASGLWNEGYKEISDKAHMGSNGIAKPRNSKDRTFLDLKQILLENKKISLNRRIKRKELFNNLEPYFNENKSIFSIYGPNNDYKYNAESEIAHAWKEKIESCILPNNHKIIDLFEQNYFLLTDREKEEFQIYKVHTKDFNAKHTGKSDFNGQQFPREILNVLRSLNE